MIGSLGHWLAQQDVARGGQPSYYFAFFLIPIYEFLGAFGTFLAFYFGLKQRSFWSKPIDASTEEVENPEFAAAHPSLPVPAIFIFFTITSLIAYHSGRRENALADRSHRISFAVNCRMVI